MLSVPMALLAVSFAGSVLVEALVLSAARRCNLTAIPNERSFHSVPTPTIGGLAILIMGGVYLATYTRYPVASMLLVGGLILGAVGLWDDLRELSRGFRFVVQLAIVAGVVAALDSSWKPLVIVMAGFLMLWHINLFNFMDGIDGIAGSQVVVFCSGALLLGAGNHEWIGGLLWVLMGASMGFLAFNWPPARIFMGDVGTLFLGLALPVAVIELSSTHTVPLTASLILLSVFWFDATYTLAVRIVTGQKFTHAHRSHLYQQLAAVAGHRSTTAMFLVYSALWLIPLSLAASRFERWGWVCVACAVLPLLGAAVAYRAGRAFDRSPEC